MRVVTRKMPLTLHTNTPTQPSATPKHCILLHGWASEASALRQLREELQALPQAADWHFWDITYDTTWTRFAESARLIQEKLAQQPHDFSNSIIIGYSMGGLVARQMIAHGLPCKWLVTICTPHHGPVKWLPVPAYGPRSIASWSATLAALNRNPVDAAHRDRYRFFAITYTDLLGHHEQDGLVTAHSALGMKLGPVALRRKMDLKYSAIMPYFDPHWRGMFPKNIRPVIDDVAGLLKH
jgi:pimeloyl-ACP methyl ester carboxylesterase